MKKIGLCPRKVMLGDTSSSVDVLVYTIMAASPPLAVSHAHTCTFTHTPVSSVERRAVKKAPCPP